MNRHSHTYNGVQGSRSRVQGSGAVFRGREPCSGARIFRLLKLVRNGVQGLEFSDP